MVMFVLLLGLVKIPSAGEGSDLHPDSVCETVPRVAARELNLKILVSVGFPRSARE